MTPPGWAGCRTRVTPPPRSRWRGPPASASGAACSPQPAASRCPSLIAAERALSTGCHLPIAFGAVTAAAGLGERDALRGLLFSEARTVFSAAVRLGIAGPLDAQARLARLAPEAETLAETSRSIPPDAVHTTSPLLTLLGGEQPRLYSKLFQS